MKKGLLRFFAALLACSCFVALFSGCEKTEENGKEKVEIQYTDGLSYEINGDGTGYVVAGIGEADGAELVIPPEWEGKPVLEIAVEAFKGNVEIERVVLPDGVTKIGEDAFYDCSVLSEVIVPESVTEIGQNAFSGPSVIKIYYCGTPEAGKELFRYTSNKLYYYQESEPTVGGHFWCYGENGKGIVWEKGEELLLDEICGVYKFYSMTASDETFMVGDESPIGILTEDLSVIEFRRDGVFVATRKVGEATQSYEGSWEEKNLEIFVTLDDRITEFKKDGDKMIDKGFEQDETVWKKAI